MAAAVSYCPCIAVRRPTFDHSAQLPQSRQSQCSTPRSPSRANLHHKLHRKQFHRQILQGAKSEGRLPCTPTHFSPAAPLNTFPVAHLALVFDEASGSAPPPPPLPMPSAATENMSTGDDGLCTSEATTCRNDTASGRPVGDRSMPSTAFSEPLDTSDRRA